MNGRDDLLRERVVLKGDTLCWASDGQPIRGFRDRDGYHRFTLGAGRHGKVHHFAAHRVVWFLTHGVWPAHEIDHINRDRSDNRIENLRDVPRSVNHANTVRPTKYRSSNSPVLPVPATGAMRLVDAPLAASRSSSPQARAD